MEASEFVQRLEAAGWEQTDEQVNTWIRGNISIRVYSWTCEVRCPFDALADIIHPDAEKMVTSADLLQILNDADTATKYMLRAHPDDETAQAFAEVQLGTVAAIRKAVLKIAADRALGEEKPR